MLKSKGLVLLLAAFCLGASTNGEFAFRPIGGYPKSFDTEPRGVNLSKAIVGFYQPMGGFDHGYLQVGKNFRTIEPAGVLSSYLESINDEGTAVGGYCDTASCNGGSSQHGYLYGKGKYTTFDYPIAGHTIAPQGINNLGQVVGGLCDPGGANSCPDGFLPSSHAFLLSHGKFKTLDFPAANHTMALAINDLGSTVGYFEDSSSMLHGYIRHPRGAFKRLDFPNANWTIPLGINNSGTISGIYAENITGITHGFIYSKGVFTQVDVPGSTATGLGGINNRGEVTATANINSVRNQFMGSPTPK